MCTASASKEGLQTKHQVLVHTNQRTMMRPYNQESNRLKQNKIRILDHLCLVLELWPL